ncbi:MAG: HNH endonuclease [Phormidesmis sp. RL_2_1]|nr:HNH endonuclease [Phormidesmis sp. RL_2_1]
MSHVLYATRPVILFSQNYLPMAEINLKRAAVLLVTDRAVPLSLMESGDEKVWQMRSPHRILNIPKHIRLTVGGSDRIWKVPPVNRREVLRRDRHTCQYCGSQKQLTLDHVIPRAQGGQHTWDNVVAACSPCNTKKGACTPLQSEMALQRKPKAPMNPVVAFAEQFWKERKT